ncbi:hypothetical protein [Anaerosolibacter sp.]|uniref:hypothetical protein n=1 Tax=Anaerosolibacter sp. TaxID=1872527 RepID=UPI0039EF2B31
MNVSNDVTTKSQVNDMSQASVISGKEHKHTAGCEEKQHKHSKGKTMEQSVQPYLGSRVDLKL